MSPDKHIDMFLDAASGLRATKWISKFDDEDERKKVKDIIKNKDIADIAMFFADDMKDPDFLATYIISNV
jgi:hypothetical protein